MASVTSILGVGPPPSGGPVGAAGPPPISGREYLNKLRKYLGSNLPRLAPPTRTAKGAQRDASWLQQSYTILTLGLDPSSAPLSRAVKVPLTLGFGAPAAPQKPPKPLLLRLPPDKLLYLLLRWQSLPQALSHVGRTDVPVPDGVKVVTRGPRTAGRNLEGDVESVRSWVGSIRSVSMPIKEGFWWSKPKEIDEDKLLLELYSIFNTLPGLLIHSPCATDSLIEELEDAGGYTAFGGVDVRVPLDVLRNLQLLELESFDPRGLLIPPNPLLHSLNVHDVEDADVWVEELLIDLPPESESTTPPTSDISPLESPSDLIPRFPNLRFLSLHHTSLINLPLLPLTSLTHLDLSHNLLNSIPDTLSEMSSLVSLNLSNNLIVSVRNAPVALGNIHTINLGHNRIDCLVGLDRVLGLRRVDVRGNALTEAGEVGRLAVLPQVEAVWAAENPFTADEDWRAQVGASFAIEEKTLILDDTPLAWSEQRQIDAILAAKGRSRPVQHRDNEQLAALSTQTTAADRNSLTRPAVKSPSPTRPATPNPLVPTPAGRLLAPSPSSSPIKATKRRPRRRVVNLDGEPGSEGDKLDLNTSTAHGTPRPKSSHKRGDKKKDRKAVEENGD